MDEQKISTVTAVRGTVRVSNMTLRNYFAAKDMQACIDFSLEQNMREKDTAAGAYAMADTMLAERAK